MLKIPNLPTDNMYKFQVIAGVVMFLSAFGFFYLFLSNDGDELEKFKLQYVYAEKVIECETKLEMLTLTKNKQLNENGVTATDSGYFHSEFVRLDSTSIITEVALSIKYKLDSINNLIKEFQNKKTRYIDFQINMPIATGNIFKSDDWFLYLMYVLLLMFIGYTGARFTNHGLVLWYQRVQVYQDTKLMLESGMSEEEITKEQRKRVRENKKKFWFLGTGSLQDKKQKKKVKRQSNG